MYISLEDYTVLVFRDHHDCMGMEIDEIDDLVEDTTHSQRYRWLKKVGYDIDQDYLIELSVTA